jgi:hypothetical protein
VRALSTVILFLGAVVLIRTIAEGGGPLSLGFLLGIAMIAVGAARLYLAQRMRP